MKAPTYIWRICAVLGLLLVSSIASAVPSRPKSVLFVGNSLTYYNGGIDRHLKKLVDSSGIQPGLTTEAVTMPAAPLWALWLKNDSPASARSGRLFGLAKRFDVVVLQGSFLEVSLFRRAVQLFTQAIHAQGGEPILFLPWPFPSDGDFGRIAAAYKSVARELKIAVAPVGPAMLQAKLPVFLADKHPSSLGTYLEACVIYATVFGETPLGIQYQGEFVSTPPLSEKDATYLQDLAWRTVARDVGYQLKW